MNQHTDAPDPWWLWAIILAVLGTVSWGIGKVIELIVLWRQSK